MVYEQPCRRYVLRISQRSKAGSVPSWERRRTFSYSWPGIFLNQKSSQGLQPQNGNADEADKDEEGNFIPGTMKIAFKSRAINKKLCTYLKAKQLQENI